MPPRLAILACLLRTEVERTEPLLCLAAAPASIPRSFVRSFAPRNSHLVPLTSPELARYYTTVARAHQIHPVLTSRAAQLLGKGGGEHGNDKLLCTVQTLACLLGWRGLLGTRGMDTKLTWMPQRHVGVHTLFSCHVMHFYFTRFLCYTECNNFFFLIYKHL